MILPFSDASVGVTDTSGIAIVVFGSLFLGYRLLKKRNASSELHIPHVKQVILKDSTVADSPISDETLLLKAPLHLRGCPKCGYVGVLNKENKGSCLILIVLLFLFLLPGFIYLIYMLLNEGFYCTQCGADTIPLGTPNGREIFSKLTEASKETIRSWLR